MSKGPKVGDWVQVWGQVVEGATHPEDVLVEFFSHSEQYEAHVRADRVVASRRLPDFVSRCTDLYGGGEGPLWRCTRHSKHGDQHEANDGKLRWLPHETVGYFEDK